MHLASCLQHDITFLYEHLRMEHITGTQCLSASLNTIRGIRLTHWPDKLDLILTANECS